MQRRVDLRTEEQQRAEHPYYPMMLDCGNCGAHYYVHAAHGTSAASVAKAFVCKRCGIGGENVEHLTVTVPSGLPAEVVEEESDETYTPGDNLMA